MRRGGDFYEVTAPIFDVIARDPEEATSLKIRFLDAQRAGQLGTMETTFQRIIEGQSWFGRYWPAVLTCLLFFLILNHLFLGPLIGAFFHLPRQEFREPLPPEFWDLLMIFAPTAIAASFGPEFLKQWGLRTFRGPQAFTDTVAVISAPQGSTTIAPPGASVVQTPPVPPRGG